MKYDPSIQYRCAIIRGKAKNELDNILPAYANILNEICPCQKEDFRIRFDSRLIKILKISTQKTLDNHRTEIAGKLFGMYYEDEDGIIYVSERTEKLLEDNDQPSFFKDMCLKFQFPNGMDKIDKLKDRLKKGVSLRPYSYVLNLLKTAEKNNMRLTVNEIGYYVLNSLEVLQGRVVPEKVLKEITEDRTKGIIRKVEEPGKSPSFCMQHIKEQLNYLELSNLIRVNNRDIKLNDLEKKAIDYIASFWDKPLEFDIFKYDLNRRDSIKNMNIDWQKYYTRVSLEASKMLVTEVGAITSSLGSVISKDYKVSGIDKTALGDEGEAYIYNYEKERVSQFNPRLASKVIYLGKTKGLGFDVQSVIAEAGGKAEFVKYIEVKTTKRVTAPDINDPSWMDTLNITRNEWVAAEQHKEYYFIYRVYFTADEVKVFVINNPYEKNETGRLTCLPVKYRLDFRSESVDKKLL